MRKEHILVHIFNKAIDFHIPSIQRLFFLVLIPRRFHSSLSSISLRMFHKGRVQIMITKCRRLLMSKEYSDLNHCILLTSIEYSDLNHRHLLFRILANTFCKRLAFDESCNSIQYLLDIIIRLKKFLVRILHIIVDHYMLYNL